MQNCSKDVVHMCLSNYQTFEEIETWVYWVNLFNTYWKEGITLGITRRIFNYLQNPFKICIYSLLTSIYLIQLV